ncbi:MarR family winged helix-turn-helix transcriptional regulator [Furfurilactobacillus sp. WILCCON 0119]|uniref:MarR family winged helix-turn-helix transcriptional regulator n=1 Tax=Furfurilactobacillus entadae TaxID=2922307 RepID=UPI0035EC8ADB
MIKTDLTTTAILRQVDLVHREIDDLEKNVGRICQKHDLNVLDYLILDELGEVSEGARNEQLAHKLHVSSALFSIRLKRLLTAKLIQIETDVKDRRVHRILLTEAGELCLDEIANQIEDEAPLTAAFDELRSEFELATKVIDKSHNAIA